MKQLTFVLAIVVALTSCNSFEDRVDVKTSNGAIMAVHNGYDLPVVKDQKICIKSVGLIPNWYIPNTGEMKDTMYIAYNHDSTYSTFIEYKIVTVVSE